LSVSLERRYLALAVAQRCFVCGEALSRLSLLFGQSRRVSALTPSLFLSKL
jgi:hypothetical protein